MKGSKFVSIIVGVLLPLISALPQFTISEPVHLRRNVPQPPPRPEGVSQDNFHGSQFQFFDDIGFVAGSPGVEAAPVFLYSRTDPKTDPCYPESAVLLSDPGQKNPGTDTSAAYNPGADCTNPGPYSGAYSLGNPFPVYVGASWCGSVWKVNYNVYYVHDGNLKAGHKHDWEGISVVFAKDPAANGEDWWYRAGATYNHHSSHDWFEWKDLITVQVDVPGKSDIDDDSKGRNKNHPKVYVGFYSHSAYPTEENNYHVNSGPASVEYRSDDWWRLPRGEDMHSWKEIPADWDYGSAGSTPAANHANQCGWPNGSH